MASIVDSAKYEAVTDYARGLQEVWTGAVGYAIGAVASFPAVPQVSEDSVPAYPMLPMGVSGVGGLPKNGLVKATSFTVKGRPFGPRKLADYESLWGATITPDFGQQHRLRRRLPWSAHHRQRGGRRCHSDQAAMLAGTSV